VVWFVAIRKAAQKTSSSFTDIESLIKSADIITELLIVFTIPCLDLQWTKAEEEKSPFILPILGECYLLTPLPPFLAREHTCENRRQNGGTMQQFPRAIFRFNSTHERKNVTINRAELHESSTERQ